MSRGVGRDDGHGGAAVCWCTELEFGNRRVRDGRTGLLRRCRSILLRKFIALGPIQQSVHGVNSGEGVGQVSGEMRASELAPGEGAMLLTARPAVWTLRQGVADSIYVLLL